MAILSGCSKNSTKPEKTTDPYAPQTSPENVVQNLTIAYNRMDIDGYMAQMADDFHFIFSQYDQEHPGMPASFDYGDELQSHTNLFSEVLVDTVGLSFTIGERVFDAAESSPGDSLWRLPVSTVKVYLKGRLPSQPDMATQVWIAENGSALFWVRKSENNGNTNGLVTWEIVQCEEVTVSGAVLGNPAVLQASPQIINRTWGRIKSLYR